MISAELIRVRTEAAESLRSGRPVVALESTLIAHGLPWPLNLETARAAEAAVREEGAIPVTVAIWRGQPTVGLSAEELEELAQGDAVLKASRRDLALAVAEGRTAATTVAGSIYLAHKAGIRVFATGGIGGAHRSPPLVTLGDRSRGEGWDVSADVAEIARTPVAVVCAGAKSILDLPRTLEILETQSVPVIGYGTDEFPAFYLRSSGEPVTARVDTPEQAAAILQAHWSLDGGGVVVAQPVALEVALEGDEFEKAMRQAESHADDAGIRGKELTPFLLARLHDLTEGRTLKANQALVVANARLAARIARVLK